MSEEPPANGDHDTVTATEKSSSASVTEIASSDGDSPAAERDDYSELEDRLALYEWVGGLTAGLGFFLTPLFTALPACYCALRIRRWKPLSAMLIVALVATTVAFWLFVIWVVLT